jgi:hypothetical protein
MLPLLNPNSITAIVRTYLFEHYPTPTRSTKIAPAQVYHIGRKLQNDEMQKNSNSWDDNQQQEFQISPGRRAVARWSH